MTEANCPFKTAENIRFFRVQLREAERKVKEIEGIIPESYQRFLSAEAAAGKRIDYAKISVIDDLLML